MKRRLEKMKDMAGKTFAPLRQIYDGNLDASTSSAVSPFSNISSTLSKRRRTVLSKLPKTVNESKENFVLCCGCEKKEISYLVRPCGLMVSEICFRRRCCKCCGAFIVEWQIPTIAVVLRYFCPTFLVLLPRTPKEFH